DELDDRAARSRHRALRVAFHQRHLRAVPLERDAVVVLRRRVVTQRGGLVPVPLEAQRTAKTLASPARLVSLPLRHSPIDVSHSSNSGAGLSRKISRSAALL